MITVMNELAKKKKVIKINYVVGEKQYGQKFFASQVLRIYPLTAVTHVKKDNFSTLNVYRK